MPITINGTGSITGISAGGLPDDCITTAEIAAGAITRPKIGYAGAILQIVQVVKTDTFSTTTGSTFVDITGMSASITPSSASSKILVLIDMKTGCDNLGNNHRTKLVRGSTDIYTNANTSTNVPGFMQTEMNITIYGFQIHSATFLDSPATTSSVTYKLQMSRANTNGTSFVNRNAHDATDQIRAASTITLMEVAA